MLKKNGYKGALNELETQGLIQAFELAWNVIKDYFTLQGDTAIYGSRDAFRLAFKRGLLENGEVWMDMIKSRTLTSYTYHEEVAEKIAHDIVALYFAEFTRLRDTFNALKDIND